MTLTRRHFLATAASATLVPAGPARAISTRADSAYRWRGSGPMFGGFSAIEVSANRRRAVVISDRGFGLNIRLRRNSAGFVQGVETLDSFVLRDTEGQPLSGPNADAEGIARMPDGTLLIAFETRRSRIWAYSDVNGPARALPALREWRDLPGNVGLESLAVDASGAIFTTPERATNGSFPLYRFDTSWSTVGQIPQRGEFVPVALDFGPDGALYLLERRFRLAFFATRISRLRPGAWNRPETLVQTGLADLDNHEGLSVTRDSAGQLWATTISDDNQRRLQRTEIAEFRLG